MRRVATALLVAVVGVGVGVPSAGATPAKKLDDDLGAMWSVILRTPASRNPFNPDATDPVSTCWHVSGDTVAPFGPASASGCTVKTGTKIFVAARAAECSKWEAKPGQTLLACAREMENGLPAPTAVTLDDKPITLTRGLTTKVLKITLPADNVVGAKPGDLTGTYQAIGDVAKLNPLTPGTHTIKIFQGGQDPAITTVIRVKRGR